MKSTLLSFFLLVVGGRVGASLTARNTVDQCASVNEDLYVPWQGHPIKFGHISEMHSRGHMFKFELTNVLQS